MASLGPCPRPGLAILLELFLFASPIGTAFVLGPSSRGSRGLLESTYDTAFGLSSSLMIESSVERLMEDAESKIILSAGSVNIKELDPLLLSIERYNTFEEPNRSSMYKGKWHVWYSTAPPPSNGQLGPFMGSSEQEIAPTGDSYKNILRLPPNSKDNEWLTVVLDGIWEDWDGQVLEDKEAPYAGDEYTLPDQSSGNKNWGAKYWKVTFLRLNFSLFGNQLISKEFPEGVSRIWRTTYLDEVTRIVRAGRTGLPEDEYVFYMKRSSRPKKS